MSLLLHDAAQLLRPRVVTVVSPSTGALESHPKASSILVLSDLLKIFQPVGRSKQGSNSVTRQNHVTMKLSFYIAHILSTPSAILSSLCDEIVAQSNTVG